MITRFIILQGIYNVSFGTEISHDYFSLEAVIILNQAKLSISSCHLTMRSEITCDSCMMDKFYYIQFSK